MFTESAQFGKHRRMPLAKSGVCSSFIALVLSTTSKDNEDKKMMEKSDNEAGYLAAGLRC